MAWDKNKPAGSQKIRLSDEEIRANNTALEDALAREHTFPGVLGGTAGKHTPLIANLQKQLYTAAAAGGTVNAITATFAPPLAALTNNTLVCVIAAGANTTTTPTFAPDGLAAKTIVQRANQAVVAGSIPGAGCPCFLLYSSTYDAWVLLTPALAAASQAEQEAGTASAKYVAPATQQYHPSAAKAWIYATVSTGGVVTLQAGYNVSIVRNSVNDFTVTFTVPFSSAYYVALRAPVEVPGTYLGWCRTQSQLAGSYRFIGCTYGSIVVWPNTNFTDMHLVFYGDQ